MVAEGFGFTVFEAPYFNEQTVRAEVESDYKGTINKEVISAKGTATSETSTMSVFLCFNFNIPNLAFFPFYDQSN